MFDWLRRLWKWLIKTTNETKLIEVLTFFAIAFGFIFIVQQLDLQRTTLELEFDPIVTIEAIKVAPKENSENTYIFEALLRNSSRTPAYIEIFSNNPRTKLLSGKILYGSNSEKNLVLEVSGEALGKLNIEKTAIDVSIMLTATAYNNLSKKNCFQFEGTCEFNTKGCYFRSYVEVPCC